jgi:hypothetical protein
MHILCVVEELEGEIAERDDCHTTVANICTFGAPVALRRQDVAMRMIYGGFIHL